MHLVISKEPEMPIIYFHSKQEFRHTNAHTHTHTQTDTQRQKAESYSRSLSKDLTLLLSHSTHDLSCKIVLWLTLTRLFKFYFQTSSYEVWDFPPIGAAGENIHNAVDPAEEESNLAEGHACYQTLIQ